MKILMINHFTQTPGETGNGRFVYLANLFVQEGYEVEMISTSFSHRTKKQRTISEEQLSELPYRLTLVYEPGYTKNVSLKRFCSHYIFGISLKKYLKKVQKPDVIYCSVPSLSAGVEAAKYAKENNIKFIIDVQDLWPEAFRMVLNIPIISDLLFYPMKKKANYIYSSADEIIAVSNTYANRAKVVNTKVDNVHSIFLGTKLSEFDQIIKDEKSEETIKLVYIGTLGHSYDLSIVFDSLYQLNKEYKNVKMLVMGDGPLIEKFKNHVEKLGIDVEFTGSLPYDVMVKKLCGCDIAINPIAKGAAQSIINKVGDYAAAGLPVISTQECQEYKDLLVLYDCGISCDYNVEEIKNSLITLIANKATCEKMGINSRKLAEEKFDREKTYMEIVNVIHDCLDS